MYVESYCAAAATPTVDRPKPVGVSRGSVHPCVGLSWLCVRAVSNGAVCYVGCQLLAYIVVLNSFTLVKLITKE